MDNTWVKLYRKLEDNDVMKDPTALQVFVWLLLKVNKKTGEYTTGRYVGSDQLGINPSTFRDALYRLEKKYKIATLTSDNKKTTVSLLNWAKYNSFGKPTTQGDDIKTTTRRHQNDTKQDIKTIDIKTIGKPIQQTAVYGNPEINELIGYLKAQLGLPLLDDSQKVNRQYAHLCIQKFGFEKTKLAIDATAKSKFWHTKITSFRGLYYNAIKIVSSNRGEVRSVDANKVLDYQNEGRQGVQTIGTGVRSVEAKLVVRS